MKKFLYAFLFSFVMVLSTSLFGCSVPTYNIDYGTLNTVVEYNSDFSYLNSGLAIVKQEGRSTYTTQVTKDMIVSCDDTSTVGNKKLVVAFDGKTFIVEFVVKYKVEFVVDSQVINTQYVLNESEIELPDNPSIDGCEFVGWSPNVTNQISNNTVFEANFTVANSGMPLLLTKEATYGDTLQSISLPQNDNGKWQFVDDLSTPVGNAGIQKFDVKFVPNNPNLLTVKTDKLTINVAQKQLTFKNVSQSFVYDGNSKKPTYEFDTLAQDVEVKYTALNYSGEAVNVGEYEYKIEIVDPNYKGSYENGKFEILPVIVNIKIDGGEPIKFTDPYPQSFDYSILDKNNNPLSQQLIDLMGFELVAPRYQHAGEYLITANISNNNFYVESMEEGYLIVQKVEHNLGDGAPDFVGGANIVYGGTLADVKFSNLDNRGRWAWKDASIKVLTPTTFTATAVFTPKEGRDYLVTEKEVEISVSKKPLTINILQNEFTYNSLNHYIDYEVLGIEEEDVSVVIVGNNVQKNAGSYKITLSVDVSDTRYVGSTQTTLIINKASIADFSATYQTEWSESLVLENIVLNNGYRWVEPLTELKEIGEQKYLVEFTPQDTLNYKTERSEISVNVIKATSSVKAPNNYTFTYSPNGYELTGINGSHSEASVQYSYLLNGVEVEKISNVGNYQVVLTLPESQHYNSSSKTIEVVIEKVINKDVVALNYNATYEDILSEYALPTNNYGTWSWEAGSNSTVGNAGVQSHTAIYTPTDKVNYESRRVQVEFNINKKIVYAPIVESKTYDAKEYTPAVELSKYYNVLSVPTEINVGSYEVILSLKDSSNYCWDGDAIGSAQKIINFSILKNNTNNWVTTPKISKSSWDFIDQNNNQTETAGVISGEPNFGDFVVEYKQYDVEEEYSSTVPTHAGSYTARIYVKETDNFVGTEIKYINFTINYISVSLPSISSTTYNAAPQKADIAASNYYTVTQNSEYIDASLENQPYEVIITLNSTSYKWSDEIGTENNTQVRTFDFVINKVVNEDVVTENITNAVYLDNLSKFTLPTNNYGTWSWQNGADATVGNAGTQTHLAIYTPTDARNYASREVVVNFTVAKKPVQLPSMTNPVYDGNPHYSGVTSNDLYSVVINEHGVNAGAYNVHLQLTDAFNYCWEGEFYEEEVAKLQFQIKKYTQNKWKQQPNITKASWDFIDKNNEDEVTPGIISAIAEFGTVSIKYKKITEPDSEYKTYVENERLEAANYVAQVFVNSDETNYNSIEAKAVYFTVNYISVQVPTIAATTYNAAPQKANVETTNYYTVTQNNEHTDACLENEPYEVIITLNSTSYKWSDEIGTENNTQVRTFDFVINKVVNEDVVTQNITNAVYLDKLSNFTLPTNNYGTWSWQNGADATVGNAGTQTHLAIYTPTDTRNYASREVVVNFTVAKKPVDVPTVSNKEYTGEDITSGLVATELYSIYSDPIVTDIGEYSVVLLLEHPENYRWPGEDVNASTLTLKYKIEINLNGWITEPSITKNNWDFIDQNNENKVTPGIIFAEPEVGDLIIEYKKVGEADSEYKTYNKEQRLAAGSYVARAYVEAKEGYYGGLYKGNIEFTINYISVEVPSIATTTYNGSAQKANVQDTSYYTVTQNNEYTDASLENEPYEVIITLNSTSYKWSDEIGTENNTQERTFDFVINKVVNEDVVTQNITNAVYLDKLSNFTLPTNNYGTWSWQNGADATVGNAGTQTHLAIYTPTDTRNYASREVVVNFTVAKKPIDVPTVLPQEYTGSTITSGLTTTSIYEVGTDNGGINASTTPYTVDVNIIDENYCWNGVSGNVATVSYYITKNQTNNWVTEPSITKNNWDFIDENSEEGATAGVISAEADFGRYVIEYKQDIPQATYSLTVPTHAGSYTARIYVEETDNFVGTEMKYINFTINYISVSVPSIATTTYNGNPQKANVETTNYYTVTQNNEYTDASLENQPYEVIITLNSTSYKWADEIGTENNTQVRTFDFVINKVVNEDAVSSTQNATYLDKLSKFSLPTNNYGTWSWQNGANAEVGNAGTQTHKALYTPYQNNLRNYETREVLVTFNVAKFGIDVPTVERQEYTGSTITSGLTTTSIYEVGTDNGGIEASTTPYTVEVTIIDENYCWNGVSGNVATVNYYIDQNQTNNWVTAPSISKSSWDFVDENSEEGATAGVISGEADFGDIITQFKVVGAADSTYVTYDPTQVINAGSYKIRVFVAETNNYVGTKEIDIKYFDITINHISVDVPENVTTTYNGSAQTTGYEADKHLALSSSNTQTNRGSYSVTATLKDAVNYIWKDNDKNAQKTISFTINQAINDWTDEGSPKVTTTYTYTTKDTYKPTAVSKFGTPTITYYKNENGTLTKLSAFPHDVGSYKVEFSVAEEPTYQNYTAIQETFTFNITKATLTFTAPTFNSSNVYFENYSYFANENSLKTIWAQPYTAKFEEQDIAGAFSFVSPKLATTSVSDKTVNGIARKYANVSFSVKFNAANFNEATATANINLYATAYSGTVTDNRNSQSISVINYYGSIENAFKNNTSGDIIVIPDSSGEVIVNDNITIPSGMRLILPYLNDAKKHEVNTMYSSNFGKATLHYNTSHGFEKLTLTSQIVVKSGKVITNNGTITIAGELTGGGSAETCIAGNTTRYYAKLVLEDGAQIITNSTINCFGYIDERYVDANEENNNSQVIANSGSTVYIPFILHDFHGGTYLNTNKDNGVTPFNEFEVRNILPLFTIKHGASLIGRANLWASIFFSEDNRPAPVNLIGSGSSNVFQTLDSNSYIVLKYNPINRSNNDEKWANGVNVIELFGNIQTNALSISAYGAEATTANAHFPLSWRQNIILRSGTFTMNQKFKLMTGSKFTVCEDATLTIADLNIYEVYDDQLVLGTGYQYPDKPAAEFNLYGTLTATKIGGKINIYPTAKLTVTNYTNATNEVVTAVKKSSLSMTYTQTYQTISTSLKLCYKVDGVAQVQEITAAGYYTYNEQATEPNQKWVITSAT